MFAAIPTRNLWVLTISDALSRFGGQFQFFAVMALIYTQTGSPLLTALQMTAGSLPYVLLAKWAGQVADRHDPRRTIILGNLAMAALTLGYLLTDRISLYLFLNLMVASAATFQMSARAALMPQLVGKENLLKANARMATVRGGVQLLAPGLAGTLLLFTGSEAAFLINAVSYLAPALAMLWVTPVEPVKRSAPAGRAVGARPGSEAWAFLSGRPDLLMILVAYGAYEIGMWAVNALFIPYTSSILGGGTDIMGWSVSFYFGAGLLTGLAIERWGHLLRNPRLLYAAYFVGALVWGGYCLTRSIPVALVLSAFDGLVFTYAWTLFETRIQEEAPPESRGQVFALARAGDEICTVAGQVGGGAAATYAGVIPSMAGFAGLTVVLLGLIALAGGRFSPGRRRGAMVEG